MTIEVKRLRLRRDTAANWASVDPVLALGEPGWETDTGTLRIGDGTTAFTGLPGSTPGAFMLVSDLQDMVAAAATWGDFQTAVAAYGS